MTAARRGKRIVPAAAAILALFAAAYFYLHRAPKLTDKDTIVLADFENKTGDPVFDGALRQGLAVQLGHHARFHRVIVNSQDTWLLRDLCSAVHSTHLDGDRQAATLAFE